MMFITSISPPRRFHFGIVDKKLQLAKTFFQFSISYCISPKLQNMLRMRGIFDLEVGFYIGNKPERRWKTKKFELKNNSVWRGSTVVWFEPLMEPNMVDSLGPKNKLTQASK